MGSFGCSRNDSTYELDACYDEASPITSLFAKEVEPVLDGIYAGMNATIFAYGATGSGKSHTRQVTNGDSDSFPINRLTKQLPSLAAY